jgi:hypothetical protein
VYEILGKFLCEFFKSPLRSQVFLVDTSYKISAAQFGEAKTAIKAAIDKMDFKGELGAKVGIVI